MDRSESVETTFQSIRGWSGMLTPYHTSPASWMDSKGSHSFALSTYTRDFGKSRWTRQEAIMGLFEFLVLPFGITIAPAAFQRSMDETLGDYIGKICYVYVDDIIVFGREECLHNRDLVLARLQQRRFKINIPKSMLTPAPEIGHHFTKGDSN
eukprot:Protomagalhaensia_wolfi_Nauph_80__1476@NODE_1895_length_1287_cov_26_861378_g1483_i0_p1_GENE_NODE_1895_length_1287_cov_26_861378_g1483_i0NODE_1895_length_1287_cov_26_861378_g1483_i0_p1_ORF_typecomplete_len153_score3_22RVT_1/PF00078_27/2_9e09_NODE_1895_length_1287_cov_26_861378_g1483_i0515973